MNVQIKDSDQDDEDFKGRPSKAPRFTIKVSQERIDTSVERDSAHCMFADAIGDCIPSSERRSVDLQTIRWSDKNTGKRYVYLTPRKVQEYIINFDAGAKEKITPFEVVLKNGQTTSLYTLTAKQKEDKRDYNQKVRERTLIVG